MAQIYKTQIQRNAEIRPPNTEIAEYMDKKAEAGLSSLDKMLQHNIQVEQKRSAEQAQIFEAGVKKQAQQIIQNAYTLYDTQPQKYEEEIKDGLDKLYKNIPDGKEKDMLIGEVQIYRSGYDARVTRKVNELLEKQYYAVAADEYLTDLENARGNLSNLMFTAGEISGETSAEVLQKAVAGSDAVALINRAYEYRNATDSYGNPIFSPAQRTRIKEVHDNIGYYAAIDYMQDKVMNNRNLATQQMNWFVNNKETVMQAYSMDDELYEKTLKDMRSILNGQITAAQLEQNNLTIADVNSKYETAKIEIKNGKVNSNLNLSAALELSGQIDNALNNGKYNTVAEYNKLQDQKAMLDRAIVEQVERGNKIGNYRWIFPDKNNVRTAAEKQIMNNVRLFTDACGVNNSEFIDALKVEYYRDIAGYMQSHNVPLSATDETAVNDARGVANNTFIRQAQNIVGKLKIEAGYDPLNEYAKALQKAKQTRRFNNLQEELGW